MNFDERRIARGRFADAFGRACARARVCDVELLNAAAKLINALCDIAEVVDAERQRAIGAPAEGDHEHS